MLNLTSCSILSWGFLCCCSWCLSCCWSIDIVCFVADFVNSLFDQIFNHFTTKCSKILDFVVDQVDISLGNSQMINHSVDGYSVVHSDWDVGKSIIVKGDTRKNHIFSLGNQKLNSSIKKQFD